MTNYLDKLDFSSKEGLNGQLIRYRYHALARYFRGRTCLEFGCSDGQGLDILLDRFEHVTAVDGSQEALSKLPKRKGLTPVHSMFEALDLGRTFDTVLMGHILEHVVSPRRVIRVGLRHLKPSGVLIADVPNAQSIHRAVGVKLGMLRRPTDLNEADRRIGHRRVYTPDRFMREFESAGLRVLHTGGFFLKPLSNAQMEEMLDREQIEAFFRLGEDLPEIAAEIYVVCGCR